MAKSTLNEYEQENEILNGGYFLEDLEDLEDWIPENEMETDDEQDWKPEDVCFLESPSSN